LAEASRSQSGEAERAATPRRSRLPQLTDRLPLAGLEVSPVCLGIVSDPEAVLLAYDLGVNFFFLSSDLHWPVYEFLRAGLTRLFARGSGVRDTVVVAGVSYVAQPDFTHGAFSETLAVVPGLERLDVLVAGGVYAADFPARRQELARLCKASALGASRLGASFHDRATARDAVNEDLVDVAFVRYNAAHPGAREDLFPHLKGDRRALVYGFKSTDAFLPWRDLGALGLAGYVPPRPQDHYRFVLTHEGLDGLLCAPQRPGEVRALAAALEEGPLSSSEEDLVEGLAQLQRAMSAGSAAGESEEPVRKRTDGTLSGS
jgi:hypothetical protein